jgi:DNA polymerase-3 subunit delta'
LGQYSLALALVRAWLCENPGEMGACDACTSCHAIDVHTHADLCVLMPETVMLELSWPLGEKAQAEIDDKKRKPSKEIRIEAMRDAVEFAQRTSARGRGKVVLVFPAERMNNVTANALLKTLEEPAGDVRFVLASDAAHQLLPTIRSRCLVHAMLWPDESAALKWLQGQGVAAQDAATLLRAAGGRPEDALLFATSGRDPKSWRSLPKAMLRGDVSLIKEWSPAQVIDALHKLCHDMIVLGSGGQPRFFSAADLPSVTSLSTLTAWGRELALSSRTAEHPFNTGLMLEALVSQAQRALNSGH